MRRTLLLDQITLSGIQCQTEELFLLIAAGLAHHNRWCPFTWGLSHIWSRVFREKKALWLPGKGNNSSDCSKWQSKFFYVSIEGRRHMFSFISLMHDLTGSTVKMKTEFQPYPPLPNIIILVFCVIVQIISLTCSTWLCLLRMHLLLLVHISCCWL